MPKSKQGNKRGDDRNNRSGSSQEARANAGAQTEKGDARRSDPNVNKNSQAQKDDVRDGQRDQDPHPKSGHEGNSQDGRDSQASHSRSRPSQTIGGNQGQSGKR